ncbi:MAG: MFS transporter [Deltaproteobacteria bacterium]|nr:MAG: MFS transporter [Deltaproteobacteria bacterium]
MNQSLQFRDFRYYLGSRFLALASHQVLVVALSQKVYEITRSPIHLGYIGLTLFLPKFVFALLAGHAADRFDRRRLILFCRVIQISAIMGIVLFAHSGFQPISVLYIFLFLLGMANAFDGPASQAIVTNIVPEEHFTHGVTWHSSVTQASFIIGPALGGWLYSIFGKAEFVLWVVIAMRGSSALLLALVKARKQTTETPGAISWDNLFAGIRYVFQKRIILASISLDLFAVLFGGAVALMPIFANDILKVGPEGLGLLRAAPSIGAVLIAFYIARRPKIERSGVVLLWAVVVFGLATILFGLSKNFYLSLAILMVLGGADMISVIIRSVLVQMETPQEMRGRVSAVNFVFIGASNELGEFESGLTAQWFGVVPAVVLGGLGTLAVATLWTKKFPELRDYVSKQ